MSDWIKAENGAERVLSLNAGLVYDSLKDIQTELTQHSGNTRIIPTSVTEKVNALAESLKKNGYSIPKGNRELTLVGLASHVNKLCDLIENEGTADSSDWLSGMNDALIGVMGYATPHLPPKKLRFLRRNHP